MRWCLWVSRSRVAVSNLRAWAARPDFMSVSSARHCAIVSCQPLILRVQVSSAKLPRSSRSSPTDERLLRPCDQRSTARGSYRPRRIAARRTPSTQKVYAATGSGTAAVAAEVLPKLLARITKSGNRTSPLLSKSPPVYGAAVPKF